MNTDNQQETAKDTEIAWLAGFLDSDGSVQMTLPRSTKANNHRVVNLWVDFSNGDPAIIEKASNILDKMGIGFHIAQKFVKPIKKEGDGYYLPRRKICLAIKIGKIANIKKILEALLPYFAGQKAALSRIIVKFCERRLTQGRKPYVQEDLVIVQEFFEQKDGRYAAQNLEYLDRFLID